MMGKADSLISNFPPIIGIIKRNLLIEKNNKSSRNNTSLVLQRLMII